MLSWRSDGARLFEEEIAARLGEVDTLVLNGDIFDFRWACRPLVDTIPEAITWIKELRSRFPNIKIHYVLGNHDCITGFVEELKKVDGLEVHPHWLQLSRNLFVHGDAANYRMDMHRFQKFRKAWKNDKPKPPSHARLYDFTDRLGLSYLTHALWFAGNSAQRRIAWHLDKVLPAWRDEIDQCYFGHTHMPCSGRTENTVIFHNTGSGIRGMFFSPAEFNY